MIKLLLNINSFPQKFEEICTKNALGNLNVIEQRAINAFNTYNPKLNITEIEYLDLTELFTDFCFQYYSGIIIEEINIVDSSAMELLINQDYKFKDYSDDNHPQKAYKPIAYVYLSSPELTGRNIFISQSIFPALIDNINLYLESPSFEFLNLPIYFINISYANITADLPLRDLALLIACGVHYIELFDNKCIVPEDIPTSIDLLVNKLNLEKPDYFTLEPEYKRLTINTPADESWIVVSESGNFNFSGSNEKFYWMIILPLVYLASSNNYKINFNNYQAFINKYENLFSESNDKMKRCKILLEYIKKLSLKTNSYV
jgi:hypothetical protein